jgi:hypothetical protein
LVAKKIARKKISELLLTERLGVEEEWLDPGSILKDFPTRFPKSIRKQKLPAEIKELENALDQLSKRGCHKGVLYWCLERLSPRADRLRSGDREQPSLEEDPNESSRWINRKLATREDMATVVSHIQATAKAIHRFRTEFLLCADALKDEVPLPEGILTEGPCDSIDVLSQLQASLMWVRRLAEYWETPYETTLMKSKGILYLLAYVSMFANTEGAQAKKAKRRLLTNKSKGATHGLRILTLSDAQAIGHIAYLYCGMDLQPVDLIAKLKAFQSDNATIYAKMVDLLVHLDIAARSRSA